jgi:large subunit ribosomal protein L1
MAQGLAENAKKLAEQYDYFIAQASLMPKIAANFGRTLGSRGKMPNPKLGCVVPPTTNLEPLTKRLQNTLRLQAKKGLNLQCLIGKENQPEEEIIANILAVHTAVVKQLPNEVQNVKNVALKLTMGKPVKLW